MVSVVLFVNQFRLFCADDPSFNQIFNFLSFVAVNSAFFSICYRFPKVFIFTLKNKKLHFLFSLRAWIFKLQLTFVVGCIYNERLLRLKARAGSVELKTAYFCEQILFIFFCKLRAWNFKIPLTFVVGWIHNARLLRLIARADSVEVSFAPKEHRPE
jgi:hypothetical protein